MPRRRRGSRRPGRGGAVYTWREYALVFLTSGDTKYFNTTDFEKPNDRPWRVSHIVVELVSPQIGAVVQVDILDSGGLSVATSGPRAVGGIPTRLSVRNPDMIWNGAGVRPAWNVVALKALCTNSSLQTVQVTGHLTVFCGMKQEVMPTACNIYLKTLEEQFALLDVDDPSKS